MSDQKKKLTVIGGGPGGYTAAFEAARSGMAVTLVESHAMGGTCLNNGCIPTKTIKASAEALETAQNAARFGLRLEGSVSVDPVAVLTRKERVCDTLRTGLEKTCAALGVALVRGRGRLIHSGMVEVDCPEGKQEIASDYVIIATGSRPVDLPGLRADHKRILTSDDALKLDHVPASLLIVGGGVIGCELAAIYQAFGSTVTVVEGQNRLLPMPSIDEEISTLLQREMKKRRITCELGQTLTQVRVDENGVHGVLATSPFAGPDAKPRPEKPVSAEMVLVTVGRTSNTEGLGLKEAGVAVDERGWIRADEHMRTSVANVYAIGDALGPSRVMLAHVASMEAICAVKDCLSDGQSPIMDYRHVPSAIFTSPEIGCVGMSERQARDAGFAVKTSLLHVRELGKAQAMDALPGFCKVVADGGSGALLGVHMAGAHATDLIAEAVLGLHMGASARDVAETIHAHPTLAEALGEAAQRLG